MQEVCHLVTLAINHSASVFCTLKGALWSVPQPELQKEEAWTTETRQRRKYTTPIQNSPDNKEDFTKRLHVSGFRVIKPSGLSARNCANLSMIAFKERRLGKGRRWGMNSRRNN